MAVDSSNPVVMRGRVVRVTAEGPWVEVPDLGVEYSFGPLQVATDAALAVGMSVIVASVGNYPEDVVVLGPADPVQHEHPHDHPHTHADLAAADHAHSQYATTTALSDGLATKADATHTHDTTHTHADLAAANHSHNGLWVPIEEKVLSADLAGGVGNLFFDAIPTQYTRLRVVSPWMRHTSTSSGSNVYLRVNNLATTVYGHGISYRTSAAWSGTYGSGAAQGFLVYSYFYGTSYAPGRVEAIFERPPVGPVTYRSRYAQPMGSGTSVAGYPYETDVTGQVDTADPITRIDLWNSGGYAWQAGTRFRLFGMIE